VIITKGGTTTAIRTAFMRRKLEDWERAEQFATPYTRAQVDQFSPRSQAILEIQSARDLEILEKIYANSVLLGDDGPDGWGIRYATEFHMTSDSKLFPPRTKWEEQGYRPDEYSRWLKGDWRPIAELWTELGIDPDTVTPPGVLLEPWLFDTTATPERRTAEARFIHGHLLKPGDVAPTTPRRRTAQPPYDSLPIPRADIPAGIILSREADAWIREDRAEDVALDDVGTTDDLTSASAPAIALPLFQGAMVHQLDGLYQSWDASKRKWIKNCDTSGSIGPKFLLPMFRHQSALRGLKVALRDIARSTDERSLICSIVPDSPCGNVLGVLRCPKHDVLALGSILSAIGVDWAVRRRLAGTHLNYYVLAEEPLPRRGNAPISAMSALAACVVATSPQYSTNWVDWICDPKVSAWRNRWTAIIAERMRVRISLECITLLAYGLDKRDAMTMMESVDHTSSWINQHSDSLNPVGFWRVDKDKDPELRHTVLTLIAFHDLEAKIRENNGDRDAGIAAFLSQNHGEGWLLPETLRLADYGLGHDDRAQHPQPVATRFGPRFYDWQLTQTPEESWRECHLHARNLLGPAGYQQLLTDIENTRNGTPPPPPSSPPTTSPTPTTQQRQLF
jgi:hypothetical protein